MMRSTRARSLPRISVIASGRERRLPSRPSGRIQRLLAARARASVPVAEHGARSQQTAHARLPEIRALKKARQSNVLAFSCEIPSASEGLVSCNAELGSSSFSARKRFTDASVRSGGTERLTGPDL